MTEDVIKESEEEGGEGHFVCLFKSGEQQAIGSSQRKAENPKHKAKSTQSKRSLVR